MRKWGGVRDGDERTVKEYIERKRIRGRKDRMVTGPGHMIDMCSQVLMAIKGGEGRRGVVFTSFCCWCTLNTLR